jgi:hypothetical protein
MSKLSDISNRAIREAIGNRTFSQAVLASNGASGATVKTTVVPSGGIVYSIDGQVYKKANLSAQALTALAALQNPVTGQDGFYTQPDGKTVYYLFVINAAGTVYCIQGTYASQTFTAFRSAVGTGYVPDIATPATYATIGVMKIVTSGGTFTPGTTNLDATGVTATFADLSTLPSNSTPTTA